MEKCGHKKMIEVFQGFGELFFLKIFLLQNDHNSQIPCVKALKYHVAYTEVEKEISSVSSLSLDTGHNINFFFLTCHHRPQNNF